MPKFSHDDAFPVIARLIGSIYRTTHSFVTHEEVVRAMLTDTAGRAVIDDALKEDADAKSDSWWASNMLQWFSQQITVEKSTYSREFERTKIDGAWAYKPVA